MFDNSSLTELASTLRARVYPISFFFRLEKSVGIEFRINDSTGSVQTEEGGVFHSEETETISGKIEFKNRLSMEERDRESKGNWRQKIPFTSVLHLPKILIIPHSHTFINSISTLIYTMKTFISNLVLISLILSLTIPPTINAALTCQKLSPFLSSCNNYMQSSGASGPDKACCDGMKNAISAAVTRADKRVVCGCILAMGHGDFPSVGRAAFIPRGCNITLPWPDMGARTQCSK
ncbi:hypothetical protein LUZ60_011026 [Juncus effusus]|nr:hypothetical protein LUZ60_011026 [Juncus effusus]